jgi:hypothetical protein
MPARRDLAQQSMLLVLRRTRAAGSGERALLGNPSLLVAINMI